MSVDLIVYLPRSSMPTPAEWHRAIGEAGFPVDVDADFDVDSAVGFRPCRIHGVESGFEYYSRLLDEEERVEVGAPPGANFVVSLVTHADLREFATAAVAAAVLCQVSGGLLYDPQSGERYRPGQVYRWANEVLSELEQRLAKRRAR